MATVETFPGDVDEGGDRGDDQQCGHRSEKDRDDQDSSIVADRVHRRNDCLAEHRVRLQETRNVQLERTDFFRITSTNQGKYEVLLTRRFFRLSPEKTMKYEER